MIAAAAEWLRLKALALVVTSASCLGVGAAYLVPSAPDGVRQLTFVETFAPLHVVAWVWVAFGAASLAAVFVRRMRPFALGGAAALHALWGLSFAASWVFLDGTDRAWISARSYLIVAALILVSAGIKEGPRRWVIRSRLR